jgi:hypothetical protein
MLSAEIMHQMGDTNDAIDLVLRVVPDLRLHANAQEHAGQLDNLCVYFMSIDDYEAARPLVAECAARMNRVDFDPLATPPAITSTAPANTKSAIAQLVSLDANPTPRPAYASATHTTPSARTMSTHDPTVTMILDGRRLHGAPTSGFAKFAGRRHVPRAIAGANHEVGAPWALAPRCCNVAAIACAQASGESIEVSSSRSYVQPACTRGA